MSQFSTILRYLRESKLLSQSQLAEKLEVSKSSISMYERGKREPDFETMEKIADFFNVDMNYLHGESDHFSSVLNLSQHERDLIIAYRNHPDQQASVDKLLDLPTVAKNAPVDKNATA